MRKTEIAQQFFADSQRDLQQCHVVLDGNLRRFGLGVAAPDAAVRIMSGVVSVADMVERLANAMNDLARGHDNMAASLRDVYDKLDAMDRKSR